MLTLEMMRAATNSVRCKEIPDTCNTHQMGSATYKYTFFMTIAAGS